MSRKIIWTPKAEATFNATLSYLEQHWDNKVILNFFDKADICYQLFTASKL